MNDQASTLRKQRYGTMKEHTRVISFTSGKGGVGKTHSVSNIAVSLAEQGRSVLLLDADLGLANVDVVLGIPVRETLQNFFQGNRTLKEILLEGPDGIQIIPAASGVESILSLGFEQRSQLLQAIEEIACEFDYLLIDTPAGIGSDVLFFNSASNEIVCVVAPEPTSLTDAYALIKVLSRRFGERQVNILVNNAASEAEASKTFRSLADVVNEKLFVQLRYAGWIPRDAAVRQAITARRPIVKEFPSSPASRALRKVSETLDGDFYQSRVKGGMQLFFRQLVEAEQYGKAS
ncbi:MAG: MinD/ParA family protein [Bdellovibrionales bacterium]|nr:MinD/ParA family protein [Bdellovibrionales bacterium]